MSSEYQVPSFLGQTQPTQEPKRLKIVAEAREEAKVLVRNGILHPDFIRKVQDVEMTNHIITFFNVVDDKPVNATITVDLAAEEGQDPYQLRIYTHSPTLYEEDDIISLSKGADIKTLIERGKSLMLIHRKPQATKEKAPKGKTVLLQVRIEPDLKEAFENAVEEDDETQARVIRKLIKFYLGQGPAPERGK